MPETAISGSTAADRIARYAEHARAEDGRYFLVGQPKTLLIVKTDKSKARRSIITMTWTDLVPNRDVFAPYYDEVPELSGVRVRSVHLDAWGSVVTLRLDLARFPERWDREPGDTLQCHLAFLHVEDFEMTGWRPPVTADVVLTPLPRHRLAVRVAAPGLDLAYTSNATVLAGRLSVFTLDPDGEDSGPHQFTSILERKFFPTVPATHVNTFHEHL
ncbi:MULTISPECIES: Imm50 family immunity protein [unclassified Streptomyces]|uniref:Imm50 family immunity protein n=1 Tax=unclassified Streptomyces TaxID=2593676 RepID=UPI003826EB57